MNQPGHVSAASQLRRARRYRMASVVILVLGLAAAVVVYWLGTRERDYSNDADMVGYNRAEERQLGVLYGKQGLLMEDFNNTLKRPGTQAVLIILATAVVAVGCFYFARILEFEAETGGSQNQSADSTNS